MGMGMGSGSGAPAADQASIQSLRTTRQGLPLCARVMTVSSLPLSISRCSSAGGVWFSAAAIHKVPSQPPCAPIASEATANAARRQNRRIAGYGNDLRHQRKGPDAASVAASVIALRHEHSFPDRWFEVLTPFAHRIFASISSLCRVLVGSRAPEIRFAQSIVHEGSRVKTGVALHGAGTAHRVAANHGLVNLAGTLADLIELGIAEKTLKREILHITASTC